MGFIDDAMGRAQGNLLRQRNLLQAERYGQAAGLLLDHDPETAATLYAKAAAIAAMVAQAEIDKPRSPE